MNYPFCFTQNDVSETSWKEAKWPLLWLMSRIDPVFNLLAKDVPSKQTNKRNCSGVRSTLVSTKKSYLYGRHFVLITKNGYGKDNLREAESHSKEMEVREIRVTTVSDGEATDELYEKDTIPLILILLGRTSFCFPNYSTPKKLEKKKKKRGRKLQPNIQHFNRKLK